MRRGFFAACACLAALAAACSKPGEPAPQDARPAEQGAPRFYYDLGPATVDDSGYPPEQREGYRLFLAVCGACHGTARALNAPYSDRDVWKSYLRRMRVKMEGRAVLPPERELERILDFLVYDSKLRKLDGSAEFDALQEELKTRFAQAAKR